MISSIGRASALHADGFVFKSRIILSFRGPYGEGFETHSLPLPCNGLRVMENMVNLRFHGIAFRTRSPLQVWLVMGFAHYLWYVRKNISPTRSVRTEPQAAYNTILNTNRKRQEAWLVMGNIPTVRAAYYQRKPIPSVTSNTTCPVRFIRASQRGLILIHTASPITPFHLINK